MPAKSCPACGGTTLDTDYTLGQIACAECGTIVERGILVSEVGFAEAAGGRMHVQGTFVSNYSTGIAGFRGKNAGQNSENVKLAGQEKIQQVARDMGLGAGISAGATRSFSLAVDQQFNKGRRSDYLVATCLYLQCRLMSEPYMLIDFSERLQVNVFELAGTYLKLRTYLHLDKTMPEVDPAIYNIHFARRLQLGPQAQTVAADASRLVRRFKADWMTQGRRPAGICGACLIIAARMSNFLRTPEEVGQIVKCSAYTIRKRLREFAVTEMAQKTVKEWRGLSEKDLDQIGEEEPPIVRYNRLRKEKEEKERQAREEEEREAMGDLRGSGSDDAAEEDEDEVDEAGPSRRPTKRRKTASTTSVAKGKRKSRSQREQSGSEEDGGLLDAEEAIRQAAAAAGDEEAEGSQAGARDGEEGDEDGDLDNLMGPDMADAVDAAGDDPEAAKKARKEERAAYQRQNRSFARALLQPDVEDLEDAEATEKHDGADDDKEEDEDDGINSAEAQATQLRELGSTYDPARPLPTLKPGAFDKWDNPRETLAHFTESYFSSDPRFVNLDPKHIQDRVSKWLRSDRDPKEVAWECQVVDMAYKRREFLARQSKLETLDDLDDEELEEYYVLDEKDKQLRARVWLSQNGKWLEQNKVKEEERAAYNKAHGIDPNKPKTKRKRGGPLPTNKPYTSTRAAMEGFAATKKFSSRINYGALRNLGSGYGYEVEDVGEAGLQRMDDEKEDEFENGPFGLAGFADDKEDDKEDEDDDDDAYW